MLTDRHPSTPYKPGDQVAIVGDAAQAVLGTDHGVVVGDTAGHLDAEEIKVVVAPDTIADHPNAVLAQADVQPEPRQLN